MKNKVLLSLLGLLLAACASTPEPKVGWIAKSWKDQFTDVEHAMVTMGSYYTSSGEVYTVTGGFYPFVGRDGSQVLVGLRSGGRMRVPVGDVQLRIDDNPAWTITTLETPLESTQQPVPSTVPSTIDAGGQIAAAIEKTRQLTMTSMLPYTAATGDKAQKILSEMLQGHRLRYRITRLGQAGSTTGECEIDSSFRSALIEARIPFAAVN